jgi:hypothetical protein
VCHFVTAKLNTTWNHQGSNEYGIVYV